MSKISTGTLLNTGFVVTSDTSGNLVVQTGASSNTAVVIDANGTVNFGYTTNFSSPLSLNGGTANGVSYLNASKVLTTGNVLTFDGTTLSAAGLSDSGNLTFTGTGNRIFGDFSNANVSSRLMFQSSTANSATVVSALPNGTATNGQLRAYNNSDPTNAATAALTAQASYISLQSTIEGTGTYLPMAFFTGGSERVRIDTSGNVGIGTSSPAAPLQLGDATQASREIRTSTLSGAGQGGFFRGYRGGNPSFYVGDSAPILGSSSGGLTLYAYGATSVDTYTNGILRSTLDSSGNLGLGVTPSAWSGFSAFEVGAGGGLASASATNVRLMQNAYFNGANWIYRSTSTAARYEMNGGAHAWFTASSGTAGNAITFTQAMTLDASGQLMLGTTTPLSAFTVYQASAPAITIAKSGDAGAGLQIGRDSSTLNAFIIQRENADLFIRTNNAERMRITAAGNVGIGTSSPVAGYKLDVAGAMRLGAGANLSWGETYANNGPTIAGSLAAGFLAFYPSGAAGAERARIDSSGNLGLGVTPNSWQSTALQGKSFSINALLGVDQTGWATGCYQDTYGLATGWKSRGAYRPTLYAQTGSHQWFISTAAPTGADQAITFTQAMTLDASGRLGVGTTSPGARLTVAGGWQQITNGTSSLYMGDGVNLVSGSPASASAIRFDGDALLFSYSSTERARITSTGQLLVGTMSSLGTAGQGQFVQAGAGSAGAGISVNASSDTFTYSVAWFAANRSASTAFNFINCTSDLYTSPQFRVQGNGVILATNTTVQSISDARTKENIRDSEEGLQVILGLQPRRFDFKQGFGNGRKNVLGFVAQEIEAVFPDAVSEVYLDPDNNDIAYKTVGPGELIPVLVKAIQELKAEFDAYKATHP